jgi:hypothetical protein
MKASMQRAIVCAVVGLAMGAIGGWSIYASRVHALHDAIAELSPAERQARLVRGLAEASWYGLGWGAITAVVCAIGIGWLMARVDRRR